MCFAKKIFIPGTNICKNERKATVADPDPVVQIRGFIKFIQYHVFLLLISFSISRIFICL